MPPHSSTMASTTPFNMFCLFISLDCFNLVIDSSSANLFHGKVTAFRTKAEENNQKYNDYAIIQNGSY
jgi:hypothetical protein